eukprot:TRINITY_DN878_c0_g5_i2.p1 TRINITY_DN878_c0_g5~~TRINITY_DN878_c0_g5_i2.p1  ORF type:complete len:383 (+),score=141.09 TRINITY_DN878_c0_g5_i2:1200-2348(+)
MNNEVDPQLIILDRRDDPVTPLLTQWTYQAQVHEFLGLSNNRVNMKGVPGVPKDMKEIVFSLDFDPFYRENMHSNFGDLGDNLKELTDQFQAKTNTNKNISTIEEMKQFVEDYPEFRKLSGNVTKHVTLVSELMRINDLRSIFEVSEMEQSLACNDDHSAIKSDLLELLSRDQGIVNYDRLRLILLYALKYEGKSSNMVMTLIDIAQEKGIEDDVVAILKGLLQYAGKEVRGVDLFSNKDLFAKSKKFFSSGLKGVENVYTQHKPYLATVLEQIVKGKLSVQDYPFANARQVTKDTPRDVIIFIVGGATYEEATTVYNFNQQHQGINVVLGGTFIHNSATFIDEMKTLVGEGHGFGGYTDSSSSSSSSSSGIGIGKAKINFL